ncbi:MAG: BrnT family toxin [Desulfoprunum sp.]|nr:BrnT family toxin [Desulfoprunum sp.]
MKKTRFEWDENKDAENQKKHGVQFSLAQYAFADPSRVIAEDLAHSETEKRFFVSARSRVVFSLSDSPVAAVFSYNWRRLLAKGKGNL